MHPVVAVRNILCEQCHEAFVWQHFTKEISSEQESIID